MSMARGAGGRLGIRIMALSQGDHSHSYQGAYSVIPDDLAAVVNPLIASDGSDNYLIPDWNSSAYLSRLEEMLTAIGNHYRNDPVLGFVDVSSYGNWGEFHLYPFEGAYQSSTQRPITDDNARRIVRANAAAFPNKVLVVPTAQRAALAEAVATVSPPVGIRIDCVGSVTGSNGGMAGAGQNIAAVAGASERWRTAPVITEWCNNAPASGTVFTNGEPQVRNFHMSMLSSGNWYRYPTAPSGADLTAFNTANAEAGYRLRIQTASIATAATTLTVRSHWVNDGVAPTYLPWQVIVRLVGPTTMELPLSVDLRGVQPDRPLDGVDLLPASLPAGTYTVQVRVEDEQGVSVPMALAQTGRDANGNYTLGTMTVAR
jgi:hypothetical protein